VRDRVFLIATMALCAVASLVCILLEPVPYYNDAFIYLSLGEHLAHGQGFHSSLFIFHDLIQPPLYPLAIAAGALVTTPLRAAIAITVLSWALTIPALVRIHVGLFGRRGWHVVAASVAVFPMLSLSSILVTEPLFVCLTAWSVAFAFEAVEADRVRPALLAGLLIGLSILARPEGVLTAAVLGGLGLARRRWRFVVAAPLVASTLVLPYGLFLYSQLGYLTIIPKVRFNQPYAEALRRVDWPADQAAMPRRDQRITTTLMADHTNLVLPYAFTHPEFDPLSQFPLRENSEGLASRVRDGLAAARLILWTGVKAIGFWNPLALLVMLLALRRRPRDRVIATVALVAILLVPSLSSALNLETRFLTVSSVLSLILLGGGIAPAQDWLTKRLPWRPLLPMLVVAVYAGFLVRAAHPRDRENERVLGERCQRLIPTGANVMSHNARCAYLIHGSYFLLPYAEDQKTLTDYIANHGIDYAVLDEDNDATNPSPVIRDLHDHSTWPPSWRLIEAVPSPGGGQTVFVKLR
jgi:hypothetical protein